MGVGSHAHGHDDSAPAELGAVETGRAEGLANGEQLSGDLTASSSSRDECSIEMAPAAGSKGGEMGTGPSAELGRLGDALAGHCAVLRGICSHVPRTSI